MSSETFWNLGAEQDMSVKALSSLVRNLVKLLVNNARKGACSYRTARYCAATIVASSVFGWQLHRRQLIRGHPCPSVAKEGLRSPNF